MLEFHGRLIPTTMEELVDPKHTALLVVDVQNDFCVKDGVYQKELALYLSQGDAIIRKLKVLIQEARRAGVQVVYIQDTALADRMSYSAAEIRFWMKTFGLDDPNLLPETALDGSWGQQIVEDIKPGNGDLVVKKYRSSSFVGTNLDLLLSTNGIKTLLLTGLLTQGCVESTARDAQFHDYSVVILKDCVDSTREYLHDAALQIMETRYDVATSSQIISIWKNSKIETTVAPSHAPVSSSNA